MSMSVFASNANQNLQIKGGDKFLKYLMRINIYLGGAGNGFFRENI
jgi:hypothetical protein